MELDKESRISSLEELGFNYAAAYLADEEIFQGLSLNDTITLWSLAYIEKGIPQYIRGRNYSWEKLERLVQYDTPISVNDHLIKRGVSGAPRIEEIFIIEDICKNQPDKSSERFESGFDCNRSSEYNICLKKYVSEQLAMGLLQGYHLFLPFPDDIKSHLFLPKILKIVSKKERTEKLEKYAKNIIEKSMQLRDSFVNPWLHIRNYPGERNIKKLLEEVGFDLKGYKPVGNWSDYSIYHSFAQVVKDDIWKLNNVYFMDISQDTETDFQKWIGRELEKSRETHTKNR